MKTFKFNLKKSTSLLALVAIATATLISCDCKKEGHGKHDKHGTLPPAEKDTVVVIDEVDGTLDENGNFIYNVGDNFEIELADGTTLMVGSKSTEAKLFNRLSGDYTVPATPTGDDWMVLDRVYFATGGDALTPESQTQVDNIAKILNNFPNATIKIGGYTDNTGSADVNKEVSTKRANSVMNELVGKGVAADRLKAEGFGPEFPVCPANDTPQCQAQNRRVDIRIASK